MKVERAGQIKCSGWIIKHRGVKETPYPRNGGRGDSFLRKRRERISGLFVIPRCTGDEGLKISTVHIHS